MTQMQKILRPKRVTRPRPTSSQPLGPKILRRDDVTRPEHPQNRTTATSSHLVPTSSLNRGRPQDDLVPDPALLTERDEVAETSWPHTAPRHRDELGDDLRSHP